MLENFQLSAIVRSGGQSTLRRIPLHQSLQSALAQSWQMQLDVFMNDIEEVTFDAGYQPESHERFCLTDLVLPAGLEGMNSLIAPGLPMIDNGKDWLDETKGIVAFAQDGQGQELMLFQNFSRSHVIRPGRFLFLQSDTYETNEKPGLTLEDKLSAVYLAADHKLLFQNFRTVNTFLPLADLYEEASEQQIREVLAHERLLAEDAGALASEANQWFRKRFAMLRDSRVLDKFSVAEIQERSKGFDVHIQVNGEKIVFPAARTAAKRLLQFLNEELYRGPITHTLYETNSKREAD